MFQYPAVFGLVTVFGIVAVFCLAARLWTRFFIAHNWGADDITIIVSMAFAIVLDVCVCLQFEYFLTDSVSDAIGSQLTFFLVCTSGIYSASLTKISIILFYKRVLARSSSDKLQRVMTGVICLIIVYTIVISTVYICICRPIGSYWLSADPNYDVDYSCYNDAYGNVSSSAVGAIADIIVILLPIFFLRKLAIHRKQKFLLYAIFSLGAFTCAAAMSRAIFTIFENIEAAKPADEFNADWDDHCYSQMAYWFIIEVNGGITCACVPALKPLFKRVMSGTGSFWKSNKTPNRYTYDIASTNSIWRKRATGPFSFNKVIELGNVEDGFDRTRGDSASQSSQTVLTEHAMSKATADAVEDGANQTENVTKMRGSQSMLTEQAWRKVPMGVIEKKVNIEIVRSPV